MEAQSQKELVKKSTREKILEAAIDLYSKRGVSAVSVRDITNAVGIKESALYNHFKSKDELLSIILEKFKNEFGTIVFPEEDIVDHLDELGPELFLQHNLLSLRDRITPIIDKMWIIIYQEQFRDQRVREFVINDLLNRPVVFYKKAFGVMIQKGLIKPLDPGLLADEYNYVLFGISFERLLLQIDGKDAAPAVKKMFMHIKYFYETIKV
jgi:AcrR family transcriptional regulator